MKNQKVKQKDTSKMADKHPQHRKRMPGFGLCPYGHRIKSMNGCGETSSLHTVLVSLPEIGAGVVQTGVPGLQLCGGDAELRLHLFAVVAVGDGVVLLAGRDGVGVDLSTRGRGLRRGSSSGGLGLGSLGDCDDGGGGNGGSGTGAGGSGRRGLGQDGGHAGGGGGCARAAGATRGRAAGPAGAGERGDGVGVAAAGAGGPAKQAVGNVRSVAVSSDTGAQVTVRSNRAGVVAASGLVVRSSIAGATVGGDELLQTITVGSTHGTVTDHLLDLGGRAGVLDRAVDVAASLAVVGLHETGVDDAVVGGLDADTAVALLHNDGQDEAGVDARLAGDLGDGGLHIGHLGLGGIGDTPLGARRAHDLLVALEHIIEGGNPVGNGGPSIGDLAGAAKDGGVKVAATSTEGVLGRGLLDFNYISGCASGNVCDWSPRNEGEAASSQKLERKISM